MISFLNKKPTSFYEVGFHFLNGNAHPKTGLFLHIITKENAKPLNVKKDSQYRKYCRLHYSKFANINQ
ncbi:hypothetical protein PSKAS_29360 [Peribacillus sp. N1]